MLGDIRLLHEGIGPKPPHQVIFIHQMAGVLDQDQQGFEGLGRERHGLAVESQKALLRVQAKGTESIEAPCFLAHSPGRNCSRFLHNFGRTSKPQFR